MSVQVGLSRTDADTANFWSDLYSLYKSGKFCDLRFVCQGSLVVKCHKSMLSIASEKFHELLTICSKEGQEDLTIFLPDYKGWQVKDFIDNLYYFMAHGKKDETQVLLGTKLMFQLFGLEKNATADDVPYVTPKVEHSMEVEEETKLAMTKLKETLEEEEDDDYLFASAKRNKSVEDVLGEMNEILDTSSFEDTNTSMKTRKRRKTSSDDLDALEDFLVNEEEEEEEEDEYKPPKRSRTSSSKSRRGRRKASTGSRRSMKEEPLDLDLDAPRIKKKRIRYPEPKPQSIASFDDKESDSEKLELFNLMSECSASLPVYLWAEEFNVAVHCNKYHREASNFMVLAGYSRVDTSSQSETNFRVKPIAWSYPEGPDINKQFDDAFRVFRLLYGFSDSDMYYNSLIYSRMGLYKLNRSHKLRHELKRRYANLNEEEMDDMLEREDIVNALRRYPMAKMYFETQEDKECNFILSSDLTPEQFEGTLHMTWRTDGEPTIQARLIHIKDSEAEQGSKDLMRTLFDVWCIGRGKLRIPYSEYLRGKYNEHMEAMETYAVIQDFKTKDVDGKERAEILKKEKQCTDCGMVFPCVTVQDDFRFNAHRKNHFYEKYECDCNVVFENIKQKTIHVKLAHSNGKFKQCEHCSFVGTKPWMAKHMANEHKDKPASTCWSSCICEQCGKELSGPRALYSHTLIHKEYTCNVCGEKITGYSAFCTHRKNEHGRKQEVFPCSACGKTFPSKLRVREHYGRIHMDDKDRPKQCPDCDRGFVSSRALSAHRIMAHLKTRPFKCRWGCGADYNDLSSRGTHEKKKHGRIYPWERPTGTAKI